MTRGANTPDIWLQDDETQGRADCGCTLNADGWKGDEAGAAFFFCPLHAAAADLLKAAQYALNNLEAAFKDKLITAPLNFQVQLTESRKELKAAIAKATPPKPRAPDWFA